MKKIIALFMLTVGCTNAELVKLCQASDGKIESTRQVCMKRDCWTVKESCNEVIQPEPKAIRVSQNNIIAAEREPITIFKTCEKVQCECLEYQTQAYNRCAEI